MSVAQLPVAASISAWAIRFTYSIGEGRADSGRQIRAAVPRFMLYFKVDRIRGLIWACWPDFNFPRSVEGRYSHGFLLS